MHAALEHADFGAWRGWRAGDAAPAGQDAVIAGALREAGYEQADIADGVAALLPLVGHTSPWPCPKAARWPRCPSERRNEMEFHFAMQPTSAQALLALLHRHGLLHGRAASRGSGWKADDRPDRFDLPLRWQVVRAGLQVRPLPRHDAAAMDAAMEHSEYRPAGAAVHAGAAPLAALPPG
jgi:exodeoxyribonuclease V beta subunit